MRSRLPSGKVPWELVAPHVATVLPPEVVLGPACGEDAALVRLGSELWAVASDPVTYSAADAGRLAVVVNANDVAVRGARPAFFTAVVLLAAAEAAPERVAGLLEGVRQACAELGVALVGGHTEVAPGLAHSIVVGTMLGRVEGRPITSGGLRPGDRIGLVRWAGLEGTAILLGELGERLARRHPPGALRAPEEVVPRRWLSVVDAALAAAAEPAVSALHDVTEGGVGEALHELAAASGVALAIRREAVPVLPETQLVCRDLALDPLGLIGSGALLVGCRPEGAESLAAALRSVGGPLTWIGEALPEGDPAACPPPRFARDELLRVGTFRGVRAVIFDMDGTLVDSDYDWADIRRQLAVAQGSIIDTLNGLEPAERERRWRRMCAIERAASHGARVHRGAAEVLHLLREHGIATALVTNNNDENTHALMARFDLELDVVLTRDCGLWKPSAEPVLEALRRLGVEAEDAVVVGDSSYDLEAARAAGCGAVLVHAPRELAARADLAPADLEQLLGHLEVVLGEPPAEPA